MKRNLGKIFFQRLTKEVVIEGHTDSTGSKELNERLSQERAESIEKYLVANSLIPDEKISAKGLGDSKPISTNKTPEGRSQNRRVDVIITGVDVQ